jgi:hypothetical protein
MEGSVLNLTRPWERRHVSGRASRVLRIDALDERTTVGDD